MVEGRESRQSAEANPQAVRVLALLTPREREVFDQIVLGRSNKVAAHELGIFTRSTLDFGKK
jgi:FixJ family two-component response regulator